MNLSRRKLLIGSVGAASFIGLSRAYATPEEVAALIKDIAGDANVGTGAITLNAPEIAENGNSVPISVSVDSPMSEDSFVESITLFAEGNPLPGVVKFNFTPSSGEAFASTRMRLAKTQNVVAVARMNDGSVFSDTRNVKVTIGGCGG